MNLSQKIKALRKAKSMTQMDLANRAGVDYNTLKKIESGATQQTSHQVLGKLANALEVSLSYFGDERPKVQGRTSLPYTELSWERFEDLVLQIVSHHPSYKNAEGGGRTGDGGRDITADNISISGGKSIFQSKRNSKLALKIFTDELDKINKNKINYPYIVSEITFCVPVSASAYIRDHTKTHAKALGLPEPIFWDAQTLDIFVHQNSAIINEFFSGHIQEAIDTIQTLDSKMSTMDDKVSKIMTSITESADVRIPAGQTLVDITSAKSDMRKAKELMEKKNYPEALDILNRIELVIRSSGNIEDIKKIYNNLGVCYIQRYTVEYSDKAIEYFQKALDLDENFTTAKENYIIALMNSGKTENITLSLDISRKLYIDEPGSIQKMTLLFHALRINGAFDEAKNMILEHKSFIEKNILLDEDFAVSFVELLIALENYTDVLNALSLILKKFPESITVLTFHGKVLLANLQKEGKLKTRIHDISPIVDTDSDLDTLMSAYDSFKNAKYLMIKNLPDYHMRLDILIGLRDCEVIISKSKGEELSFSNLVYYSNEISTLGGVRSENVKHFGHLLDQRKLHEAYELLMVIYDDDGTNISVEEMEDMAEKFLVRGGVEYAIKLLKIIERETMSVESQFHLLALMSMTYVLLNDKSSAILYSNKLSLFSEANPDLKKKAFSHNAAIMFRYSDETDRFLKNAYALQEVSPEGEVFKMIKGIEEDENGARLSDEMTEMLKGISKHFDEGRKSYLENPYPIFFLTKWFSKSFPEVLETISQDIHFHIHYCDPALAIENGQDILSNASDLIVDYAVLMNLAKCGQLEIVSHLEKTIYIHEALFTQIQDDLLKREDPVLRKVWQFLRTSEVTFIASSSKHSKITGIDTHFYDALSHLFDDWLIQSISFSQKNNIPLLTDDLRLSKFVSGDDIKGKSISSFVLFQHAIVSGLIDKAQYSLILGKLAENHNIFLPFDADDLYTIFQEDERKFLEDRNHPHILFSDYPTEFRVSTRLYHLMNQINLPGSEVGSFLAVIADFWRKIDLSSLTSETKINMTLFITQLLTPFIDEEWIKKSQNSIENIIEFIFRIWSVLALSEPLQKDLILQSLKKIKHLELGSTILNLLQSKVYKED